MDLFDLGITLDFQFSDVLCKRMQIKETIDLRIFLLFNVKVLRHKSKSVIVFFVSFSSRL